MEADHVRDQVESGSYICESGNHDDDPNPNENEVEEGDSKEDDQLESEVDSNSLV